MTLDIREYRAATPGIDMSNIITHQCPCGSKLFRTVVSFDDYEIASWCLDGECLECGAYVKLPCPADKD